EQLPLLGRLEQTRREAGGVEQAPEVVPRIREVGAGVGADPSWIDPAEHDAEVPREDVGKSAAFSDAHATRSRMSGIALMRRPLHPSSPSQRGAGPSGW